MSFTEQSLGTRAAFLLPSLKLKGQRGSGKILEQEVHGFLMANFGGYTAAAGNLLATGKIRAGMTRTGTPRVYGGFSGSNEATPAQGLSGTTVAGHRGRLHLPGNRADGHPY